MSLAGLAVSILVPVLVAPPLLAPIDAVRRTRDSDLALEVQRFVTPEGLTVILAPDARVGRISTQLTFRAGALYEPPERTGLAHLVEHVMMQGPTPDSQYIRLLEGRGAEDVNATTTYDTMNFRISVPPEELALALWVHADRLGHLPEVLDLVDLESHRRVVLRERAERVTDVPYGNVEQAVMAQLFPQSAPLHAGVIGTVEDLNRATIDDVKRFVSTYLVPANAVLVVAGPFDAAATRARIEALFRGLTPGARATPPKLPKGRAVELQVTAREALSRQQRVTIAWRTNLYMPDTIERLSLGAILVTVSVDGAFGTSVQASLHRVGEEQIFRLDVTLPYEKPADSARLEADAFLRYLRNVEAPRDLAETMNLVFDRMTLFMLDDVHARPGLLAQLELAGLDVTRVGAALGAHWSYDPRMVRETAYKALGKERLVLLAQPVNPRQPKVAKEEP